MGDAIYPVPAQWADSALIDSARYDEMYRSSVTDPDAFWRAEAQRLDWIKPFTSVKQTSFHEADFGIKWFADGSLNLAANALDPAAVVKIFEVKNRPSFDPLIVHVPDMAAAAR